jgi:hypothetical protein
MIRTIALALIASVMSFAPAGSAVTTTAVYTYESPCYLTVRTERSIPALSAYPDRGLIAWTKAHMHGSTPDAQLAEYWEALDTCDNVSPVAHYDWDHMVLVRRENI